VKVRLENGKRASDEAIVTLEAALGQPLSNSFRIFVQTYDGAEPETNTFTRTLTNSPREFGPHWEGFGKRIGSVAANFGTQSVMEVGLGSLWGEDPRYQPSNSTGFRHRLGHAIGIVKFQDILYLLFRDILYLFGIGKVRKSRFGFAFQGRFCFFFDVGVAGAQPPQLSSAELRLSGSG
jgi:hypothetical protein